MAARQPVLISHRYPSGATGGPQGVLRLILDGARDGKTSRSFPLIAGGAVYEVPEGLPARASDGDSHPTKGPAGRWRRYRLEWRALRGLAKEGPLHLIQFEHPRLTLLYRALSRRQKCTLTVSEHSRGGLDVEWRASGLRKPAIYRAAASTILAMRVADDIVWPSQAALNRFVEGHPRLDRHVRAKSRVVHNGVPLGELRDGSHAAGRPLNLVIIASTAPEKRVLETLAVLDGLPTASDLIVTWLGGSQDAPTTKNLALHCEGPVPPTRVREVLRRSDALILWPSEAIFDLVVLEAMAETLPVLVPPLPGFIEALGTDYPFYFRTPADLESILTSLASDPLAARKVGESLYRRAQELFSVSQMVEGYLEPPSQ